MTSQWPHKIVPIRICHPVHGTFSRGGGFFSSLLLGDVPIFINAIIFNLILHSLMHRYCSYCIIHGTFSHGEAFFSILLLGNVPISSTQWLLILFYILWYLGTNCSCCIITFSLVEAFFLSCHLGSYQFSSPNDCRSYST